MHNMSVPPPIPPTGQLQQVPILQSQINMIKEQIAQSEKNLNAQREVFQPNTAAKIDEALKQKEKEKYDNLLKESQLDMSTFEGIVNKIIEACTKENIGSGRNFVSNKSLTDKQVEMICYYLQRRIMSKEAVDDVRLHLIYFMNDMIHHGNKKGISLIKKHLELVVLPSFCYAIEKVEAGKRSKMNMLLDLWEKNRYFSEEVIAKLRDPSAYWRVCEDEREREKSAIRASVEAEAQRQLDSYEKQNKDFIEHSNNQINYIQMQINQIIQQQIMMVRIKFFASSWILLKGLTRGRSK